MSHLNGAWHTLDANDNDTGGKLYTLSAFRGQVTRGTLQEAAVIACPARYSLGDDLYMYNTSLSSFEPQAEDFTHVVVFTK